MKPIKCTCDEDSGIIELFNETWEVFFIPSTYNCGTTVRVCADTCFETEHWSHREDGQHDDEYIICHYCALKLKLNVPHIVEYDKGVKWYETK